MTTTKGAVQSTMNGTKKGSGTTTTTTGTTKNTTAKSSTTSVPMVVAASKSTSTTTTTSISSSTSQQWYYHVIYSTILIYMLYIALQQAYTIRLRAINDYGPVIHEFDPYFNYRATEYLYWNGYKRFFTWYDTTVWYPLGRPVGTTIYPGMQFIAVWLKRFLIQDYMSLNDICCYIPAWFGVITTIITGLITYECTLPVNAQQHIIAYLFGSSSSSSSSKGINTKQPPPQQQPYYECAIMTMMMMSIVPAHLMRSMGGGYDNESVAVTAMVLTFYCWIRSLRYTNTIPITILLSIFTGLSYFYMVAAWGGYVFVLNLIGVHATVLVGLGRFTTKVYIAYTLFYIIGTILAIQVPVVGYAPLKSLEQLGPCAVFFAYQLLFITEQMIHKQRSNGTNKPMSFVQAMLFRVKVFGIAGIALLLVAMIVLPTGYFGPISSRVRGLFVKHTKTGNPLVDSVAEHQPASTRAYFDYLHHICSIAPIGYILVGLLHMSDSSSFLLVWGASAYYFSLKMVRLVLLTAPIACILGGIVAGRIISWCLTQWWDPISSSSSSSDNNATATKTEQDTVDDDEFEPVVSTKNGVRAAIQNRNKPKRKGGTSTSNKKSSASDELFTLEGIDKLRSAYDFFAKSKEGVIAKRLISVILLVAGSLAFNSFVNYSWRLSYDLSHPTIIQKARTREGQIIFLDDYRDAYWWIRDNTPKDSRIMAWWDYGYQISAIANRTTIADGNTWNHEHIALLGKALTSEMDVGYEIARHLADYVLIWGGGGGDDLAKSPHLARIANSVYRDHCPNDPTCRAFGVIDRQGTPSPMMRRSLLFGLHSAGIRPDVVVSPEQFQEVFRSKYGKVRIYKVIGVSEESKKWVEENRVCDVKGSWFCPGQYPPGLKPFIDAKTDFRQLEDFNRGAGGDAEYTKRYFEDLQNPGSAQRKVLEQEKKSKESKEEKTKRKSTEAELARLESLKTEMYNRWEDSEEATRMWNLINENKVKELEMWLTEEPQMAFLRSKDGRGPMFWAFESRNEEITKLLMRMGLPHTDSDSKGLKPADLLQGVK